MYILLYSIGTIGEYSFFLIALKLIDFSFSQI